MFNFEQVTADARAAGAVIQVPHAGAAVHEALQLLQNDSNRRRMSDCGRSFASRHRGATERTMVALRPWLE
jgi:3-deoxy-D-manno-octulosonic-acid transferase